MNHWLQRHGSLIGLNIGAILIFVAYVLVLTNDVRTRVDDVTYRIILVSKILFFLIPVYLHNLVLVRYFLDRGRISAYVLGIIVLLTSTVLLDSEVVKLYNSRPVPTIFIVTGQILDLVTGAGALFMYRNLKNRYIRQQEALLQREYELKMLQERLDQHFLFNSLNAIYSYIESNPPLASALMEQLSSLLRYQLRQSNQSEVSLKEELDFIQSYLLLQETRLNEQANINFNIEGETQTLMIAPMLLIPFIENAFKHAFLGSPNSIIELNITVEDNVLKMDLTNTIDKIILSEGKSLKIGLTNAKKRLSMLYPGHQLNIKQQDNMFCVCLQLKLTA